MTPIRTLGTNRLTRFIPGQLLLQTVGNLAATRRSTWLNRLARLKVWSWIFPQGRNVEKRQQVDSGPSALGLEHVP